MALEKQKIPIKFIYGMDDKTDDKDTAIGFELIENGVFKKQGKISKRNGLASITALSGCEALTQFNSELIGITSSSLYAYSENTGAWVNKGTCVNITSSLTNVVTDEIYAKTQPSCAIANSVSIHAWKDARNSTSLRYSVIDTETDTVILSDQEIANTWTGEAKCVAFGDYLVIIYRSGTTLSLRHINSKSPTTISSAVTIATVHSDGVWDAISNGDFIYVAFKNATPALDLLRISKAWIVGSPITTSSVPVSISLAADTSQRVWTNWVTSSDVRSMVHTYSLVELLASTELKTTTGTYNRIGSVVNGTSCHVFYEKYSATASNTQIDSLVHNIAGAVTTAAAVFRRSVGLWSKPFSNGTDVYVNVIHDSALQASYFTLKSDGNVAGKINYQVGGGLHTTVVLQEVIDNRFDVLRKGSLQSSSGTLFSITGVQAAEIQFGSSVVAEQQANNLIIAGGVINLYDGETVSELGFNLFPEGASGSGGASGGGMSDGAYLYRVCYEWTDTSGNIHRSAPSVSTAVTLSGGGSSQKVTMTIPTLRITNKTDVRVVLYRTEASGTLYYQVSSVTSPTPNVTSADTVTIEDKLADADIISRAILYTTGGVVEHVSPPAAKFIAALDSRIVLAGTDDGSIWYSKESSAYEPVAFYDGFTLNVDQVAGKVTALGVLDGKIIIFKKTGISVISGKFGNNSAQEVALSNPVILSRDVGCSNQKSVVLTPMGLMFQSDKGIYVLQRDMTLAYIGASVESYNSLTVCGSAISTDQSQVRFVTENQALVYDWQFNLWSIFSGYEALDCISVANNFYVLKSGKIQKEVDTFTDDGASYALKLRTNWLNFNSIVGMQRLYKAVFLGSYKSRHVLRVKLGFDFSSPFKQTENVNLISEMDSPKYGEGDYGDGTYGGDAGAYLFEIRPEIQRCKAVRFQIEDTQDSDFGEGFDLSAMVLEVGLLRKLGGVKSTRIN